MDWNQKEEDLGDPATFVYVPKPILVIGIVEMHSLFKDSRGMVLRHSPGWMSDLTRAAAGFMGGVSGIEDAQSMNDRLLLRFMIQINPELVAGSGAKDSMSPIIADALLKLANEWGTDVVWESIGYSESIITISHPLKSFAHREDGYQPRILGFSNPRDLMVEESKWNIDEHAFSGFVVAQLDSLIDRNRVMAHLGKPFEDCLFEPELTPVYALS